MIPFFFFVGPPVDIALERNAALWTITIANLKKKERKTKNYNAVYWIKHIRGYF